MAFYAHLRHLMNNLRLAIYSIFILVYVMALTTLPLYPQVPQYP